MDDRDTWWESESQGTPWCHCDLMMMMMMMMDDDDDDDIYILVDMVQLWTVFNVHKISFEIEVNKRKNTSGIHHYQHYYYYHY